MKKAVFALIVLVILSNLVLATDEGELFDRARRLFFDKQWERALDLFNEILEKPKAGKYSDKSLFFKGRCLEELGRLKDSLGIFELYLDAGKSPSFKEEARVSIIDIAFALYEKGERDYIKKIYPFINDSSHLIAHYYAGFKLSYAEDKEISMKGAPILMKIIREENDRGLINRAKIALLRIDPELLKEIDSGEKLTGRILHIEIYDKRKKRITSLISIPVDLADLTIGALDPESKEIKDWDKIYRTLKEEGFFQYEDEKLIIKLKLE